MRNAVDCRYKRDKIRRCTVFILYLSLELSAADFANTVAVIYFSFMIARRTAGCAFSVFIDVLVVGNYPDIFQRQIISVYNAAVGAVKRAIVAEDAAESRLFIFA